MAEYRTKKVEVMFGGRPMKYVRSLFTDIISGLPVNLYEDKKGRFWMANSKWGWFRVATNNGYHSGNEKQDTNGNSVK